MVDEATFALPAGPCGPRQEAKKDMAKIVMQIKLSFFIVLDFLILDIVYTFVLRCKTTKILPKKRSRPRKNEDGLKYTYCLPISYGRNGIFTTTALMSLLRILMKISVSFLLKAFFTKAVPMFLPVEGDGLPERTMPMQLPSASHTS